MHTMLIVIMLIMGPDGSVSKQTTETEVKNEKVCEEVQLHIFNQKIPPNMRLVSVICNTTGSI